MDNAQKTQLDRLLALIPTDSFEVPTLPDVTGLSPLAAAKAMATYHRSLAGKYQMRSVTDRLRTRAMIIIGALVTEHASPTLQQEIRDLITKHALKRDYLVVGDVVPWAAPAAPEPTEPTPQAPAPDQVEAS